MKNYYEILQISPKASPELVKAAYTILIKKYHPDNNAAFQEEATAITNEINEAYAILSHPKKRVEYDASFLFSETPETKINTSEKNVSNSTFTEKKQSVKYIFPVFWGIILCLCLYIIVKQYNITQTQENEINSLTNTICLLENQIDEQKTENKELISLSQNYQNLVSLYDKNLSTADNALSNCRNKLYDDGYSLTEIYNLLKGYSTNRDLLTRQKKELSIDFTKLEDAD